MKLFRKYAACLLLAAIPVVSSCSDDEESVSPPAFSREIVRVDIYKVKDDAFQMEAQYRISYNNNLVSDVRTDYRSQEVNFSYAASTFGYRWIIKDDVEGISMTRFEAELRDDGRVQVGSAVRTVGTQEETKNYAYYYNSNGYITDATYGGEQSFNYDWGSELLTIKGRPATYDAQYRYSGVANDYSFDLNVLPLLVDERTDVMLAMNAYGQMAGVTGTRYPYFLERTGYSYKYMYDGNGRLVQIQQLPLASNYNPLEQQTYWFMLTYND